MSNNKLSPGHGETNTVAATTAAMFLCAAVAFTLHTRKIILKRRNAQLLSPSLSSSSSSLDNTLTMEQVLSLRSQHFCGNVSISYLNSGPLMIVGGKGSRLVDDQNVSYLDTRNNVAHCGHQHPHIIHAIQSQLVTLNTNTRYLHPNVTRLAQQLAHLLPNPLEVVFLVNSGSEANDLALRLARAFTQSRNTIVLDGAYHGHTLSTLEVSPYKYEHSMEFNTQPTSLPGRHVYKVPCPDTYRGLHRGEDAAERYAEHVVEACRVITKVRGERVGAFLVEGGMSVAGVILPPPGYLKRCVDAVREGGGVYVADEVQTGFGRFGSSYWAFQHNNHDNDIVPDIVTVGKPFGNGMPLAAVITNKSISTAFESMGVEYFNTFGGNPVCAAAGLAVLDVIESEHLQQHALQVGNYLKSKFTEMKNRVKLIGDVRGSGLFLGIELVRDQDTQEPASQEASILCTILKVSYAILTSIDGFHDNVLVVKPPMVFSMEDADYFLSSFESAIKMDDLIAVDLTTTVKTPT